MSADGWQGDDPEAWKGDEHRNWEPATNEVIRAMFGGPPSTEEIDRMMEMLRKTIEILDQMLKRDPGQ